MVQNALDMPVDVPEAVASMEEDAIPTWADSALRALEAGNIHLDTKPLTRAQSADVLYQTVQLRNAAANIFEE